MGDNSSKPSPAVVVAKELQQESDMMELANGVKIRIKSVSAALISDVTSHVKDPVPPMVYIKDKERDEANPDDPTYLDAVRRAEQERGTAVIDAMVMFGVELVDGIPEGADEWLKKLRFMERRKMLDLSAYDLDDPMDAEFLYKRYVIVDNNVINAVTRASGLSGEEIEHAEKSFRSK